MYWRVQILFQFNFNTTNNENINNTHRIFADKSNDRQRMGQL